MGIDPADHEPHIDVCDPFVLAIHLEDQEDGSSPTELGRTLRQWGHERALGDEFLQMVKGDVLHAEGLSYGTKVNVPQIESILTLEGSIQHQLNMAKVKCRHGIHGSMCMEEGRVLTLDADDDTWMKRVAESC